MPHSDLYGSSALGGVAAGLVISWKSRIASSPGLLVGVRMVSEAGDERVLECPDARSAMPRCKSHVNMVRGHASTRNILSSWRSGAFEA